MKSQLAVAEDTKELFTFVRNEVPFTRKPGDWDDANKMDFDEANKVCIELTGTQLTKLPTYDEEYVYGDTSDWDAQPDTFSEIPQHLADEMIFILVFKSGRAFVINTEGFDYCRYVCELTSKTNSLPQIQLPAPE